MTREQFMALKKGDKVDDYRAVKLYGDPEPRHFTVVEAYSRTIHNGDVIRCVVFADETGNTTVRDDKIKLLYEDMSIVA